ncbi:MAG: hypothetical protein QOD69_749 [Solirubrobacteraceae bacterium]|jgi:hypothetical protein|nr:hypothetical protein [Solirubrobacteraceae bacterium]
MTVRTRRLLVGASFVAGVVLMIGSDRPWTRVLGIACLLGFVVAGLFVVADPEFLAGDGHADGAG